MRFVAGDAHRRVLLPEIAQATHLPPDFVERINEYAPGQNVPPAVTRHWEGKVEPFPKIPAIKAYRSITGCGLREAKDTVEFFMRQGYTWTTVTHE